MEKKPGDLVTVADHEAEQLITEALLRDDPHVLVVGEEATAADPDLPKALAGAGHAFTVDPVDGTKNFVNGSPDHAVMLAELRDGEPVRAWILHPAHDVAYVAEKGAGVYRDGVRLPAMSVPADGLTVCTSSPSLEGRHGTLDLGPTAWSCGIDYPWLLEGRAHALHYTRGLPWDHAPGSLMTEELGGVVRFLDGTRYGVADGARGRTGLLAAASPDAWDEIAPQLADLRRG
ncbi:inositol monophosphatase family protein [Mobilicoccus caccae]|uniref:Inositol monophosphatase n=1 Tax=Mobilicoccus caccae TaxID=1859295 RepID=A0ABQ6IXT6_9MICO|nr:inositol monophosphatase family protein [Mobilicoccus caccae]GMA41493.1 inositol monophosphatase [Mobilicoccus caccae]